jgi:error-prone DNA polymerase
LFSRFISEERREPPDIDVDFEHERREEVIQYIYQRYGRHRAGIAATVIHYRSRSAIREVGKALGLSEDLTSRLSSTVWGSYSRRPPDDRFAETGLDPANPQIRRLADLVRQILQFPRHLGQHVGGFVLTQDRLDETVPIHNAAMAERTFIEWDKDDIDALGLMKVDILGLGMLTCIRKAFDLLDSSAAGPPPALTLQNIPPEDAATYDMLCRGDSIGVFQVESRAQMNMLPRLRPREFYDLVIQVAIVRPGPIEGEMVHPYLRRRSGIEAVEWPSPKPPHDPDELKTVLGRTFGVPLFQEQAMKLAIVAAGFSPSDANKLRRAMATFRNVGTIHHFEAKMVEGMAAKGYERDFAQRCYNQIKGFGSYGFPESHAIAFARLVYVSSWLKCHHPAAFAAALLNAQPMGFYAPAQIVRDAREHGVPVRAIDVNHSDWDNGLETAGSEGRTESGPALRLGFRQIDGFREDWAQAIVAARPFASVEALARQAALPPRALRLLADADAMRSIGLDRREALWAVRRTPSGELPLFAAARAAELSEEHDAPLPQMPRSEHVITDYQTHRLSLNGHPMEFLRGGLAADGILTCAQLAVARNGSFQRVAGVVLVRQRPGKGNAIFITLEDESGVANLLLWASRFEKMRRAVMAARLMIASGEVQRSREGVTHLLVSRIEDATAMLDRLALPGRAAVPPPHIDAARSGGDARSTVRIPMARADEVNRPVYRNEEKQAAAQVPDAVPAPESDPGSAPSPAKPALAPVYPRHGHPRNVRILPKSRDFH